MSDRCYAELVCAPWHEKKFEQEGFIRQVSGDDTPKGLILMTVEETNGIDNLEQLRGVPYYGKHGPSLSYGPGLFVSDGKQSVHQWRLYEGDSPAISVPAFLLDSSFRQALDDVELYWKTLRSAEKALAKLVITKRKTHNG